MKKKGHYAEETFLIVLVQCGLVEKNNQRLYTQEYSLVMLCRHLKYHDENVQKLCVMGTLVERKCKFTACSTCYKGA